MLVLQQIADNNDHSQIVQQALAVHLNTTSSTQEKEIVYQGIIVSEQRRPNELAHRAILLDYRQDGSIYRGTLTFTSTKPVQVDLSHIVPVDNATLSQIDKKTFGELYLYHSKNFPGTISAPTFITPDYGTSPPYYAASIPFVASAIQLISPSGEAFIAVYEVSAEVVKPQIVDHIREAIVTANITSTERNQQQ